MTEKVVKSTAELFDEVVAVSRQIFVNKLKQYGPSWRHFRPTSLVDQMLIKARRIRTLETTGQSAVGEGIPTEYQALMNYSVMTIYQIRFGLASVENADEAELEKLVQAYDLIVAEIRRVMLNKNQDYGEAWKDMLLTSLTDMILVKLIRIRQLLAEKKENSAAEAESNLQDIFNYAVFALIKWGNRETGQSGC